MTFPHNSFHREAVSIFMLMRGLASGRNYPSEGRHFLAYRRFMRDTDLPDVVRAVWCVAVEELTAPTVDRIWRGESAPLVESEGFANAYAWAWSLFRDDDALQFCRAAGVQLFEFLQVHSAFLNDYAGKLRAIAHTRKVRSRTLPDLLENVDNAALAVDLQRWLPLADISRLPLLEKTIWGHEGSSL